MKNNWQIWHNNLTEHCEMQKNYLVKLPFWAQDWICTLSRWTDEIMSCVSRCLLCCPGGLRWAESEHHLPKDDPPYRPGPHQGQDEPGRTDTHKHTVVFIRCCHRWFTPLSACPYVCLPACLPVYLPLYLSVSLSACLSFCPPLSLCLSVERLVC